MTDIPEGVREIVARAIAQHDARQQGAPFPVRVTEEDRAMADAALSALRMEGWMIVPAGGTPYHNTLLGAR